MALQLNLNQMYFFYMVALHKGVRKSAKFLHVSPPAVSAQIKRLEESLGFPLMNRVQGKFSLTGHGEKLFPQVEKLFQQAQKLEDQIQHLHGLHENKLELGGHFMHLQCVIPKLMPHYANMKKDIPVHLTADFQENLLMGLKNKELHVALLEHHAAEEGLHIQKFLHCNIFALVCDSNGLGVNGPISLHDLEDTPLLLPKHDSGFATCLHEYFAKHDFVPKNFEEFTLPINRRLLPKSGYVAFFPEYFVDNEINGLHLRKIAIQEPLPQLDVFLAHAQHSTQTKTIESFLESLPSQEELIQLVQSPF